MSLKQSKRNANSTSVPIKISRRYPKNEKLRIGSADSADDLNLHDVTLNYTNRNPTEDKENRDNENEDSIGTFDTHSDLIRSYFNSNFGQKIFPNFASKNELPVIQENQNLRESIDYSDIESPTNSSDEDL